MRLPSRAIPVLLALAACRPPAPAPMMTDPVWKLVEVEGRRVEAGPRQPFLRFHDRRSYGGNTGCNDYGGRYRIRGTEISFGAEIEMTQQLCVDVEEQERAFIAALRSATRFTYSTAGGHTLVLLAGDRPVARFIGEPPPDRA